MLIENNLQRKIYCLPVHFGTEIFFLLCTISLDQFIHEREDGETVGREPM